MLNQRYRLDASDHVVERHDVPDREYAGYPAMVLPYRSGQMVYHRVKDVMIKGLPAVSILKEIGILSFMAVVLVFLSVKRFKIRL